MENFDTLMVRAGYDIDPVTKSVTPPIYQTNAYVFDSTEHAKNLFELKEPGNIYSRIMNPTVDILEKRIAALEGGVGALAVSSGHAAIAMTVLNLAASGDEIISSRFIYGGAINMLGISFSKLGINVRFVDINNLREVEENINDKTKFIFAETIGNPNADITDIEALAAIAHKHGLPLVIDSTFTSPYLIRPFEYGADIVIHSATKCLDGHSNAMGGIVVDSGKFKWKDNPRFPQFNNPDPSYHGVVFCDSAGGAAFITRLRVLILRDFGSCLSPFNAFLILNGIETLSLRMRKHSDNAYAVARYLKKHPDVSLVNYAAFEDNKYYNLYKKYYSKNGLAAVFTFELKGTREQAGKFIDNLKLIMNVANVCDVRSLVIHPATTTHSQLSAEQLKNSGISEQTIRLSVGIEDINDIIADIDQAIEKSKL